MSDSAKERLQRAEGRMAETPIKERTKPRENPPIDQARMRLARSAMAQVSGH